MLELESELSMEEVERNFEGFDFFAAMVESLNEVLAYERGELQLSAHELVDNPERIRTGR